MGSSLAFRYGESWPVATVRVVIWVLAVAASTACGGKTEPGTEQPQGDESAAFDPCGGESHPCTMRGVSDEIWTRTSELARLAGERLDSPDDFQEVADWLAHHGDVSSVATGPEAIRFRVRGGRGHWIFTRTAGEQPTLGAPPIDGPDRVRAEPHASTGGSLARLASLSVPSLSPAASAAALGPVPIQGTTKGREKKALLMSPMRWQWEVEGGNDGIEEIEEALKARDYERIDVWSERLDPDNPGCEGKERWERCKTVGEIGLRSFTEWTDYDFIYLVTHGGAVTDRTGTLTAIMTPWTTGDVRAAANTAEIQAIGWLGDLLDLVGTESASVRLWNSPKESIPRLGRGQEVDDAVIPWFVVEDGPEGLNPDLTPDEREWCEQEWREETDRARYDRARRAGDEQGTAKPWENLARTPDGKRCGVYSTATHTGEFILLTSKFFRATYPNGIDDAVILISACSSGSYSDLLEALRGSHTAVLGWKGTMTLDAASAAGALLARELVEVDEATEDDSGLTVEQSIERIRDRLEGIANEDWATNECLDPPSEEVRARCAIAEKGRVLTIINDVPADPLTGASLVVAGNEKLRAREIVYLVDAAGRELPDRAALPVLGAPQDGKPDSVEVTFRVDGLGMEDDPREVNLRARVEGAEVEVAKDLEREVRRGVWELDYQLPLARDHRSGERVDIEVIADLPTGGDTRWEYRDMLLASCWFTATVSGPAVGGSLSLSGADVQLREDPDSGVWSGRLFSPQAYSITENTVYFAGTRRVEIRDRTVSGRGITIQVESMGDWPGRPKGERLFTVIFHEDVRRSGRSIVPAGQAAVLHSLIVPNDGGPSPTGTLEITPSSASQISGRFRSRLQPRHQILTYNALVRPREVYPEIKANEAELTGTLNGCR